jgi:hypothetical protein
MAFRFNSGWSHEGAVPRLEIADHAGKQQVRRMNGPEGEKGNDQILWLVLPAEKDQRLTGSCVRQQRLCDIIQNPPSHSPFMLRPNVEGVRDLERKNGDAADTTPFPIFIDREALRRHRSGYTGLLFGLGYGAFPSRLSDFDDTLGENPSRSTRRRDQEHLQRISRPAIRNCGRLQNELRGHVG